MTDTWSEALGYLVLGSFVASLKCVRADVAQRRVSSLTIIKQFNVLEKVLFGRFTRLIILAINPFALQAPEETFHHRIIPAIALTAHAAHHLQVFQRLLIGVRSILRAPVAVMQQPRCRQTLRRGRLQGRLDQRRVDPFTRGPARTLGARL